MTDDLKIPASQACSDLLPQPQNQSKACLESLLALSSQSRSGPAGLHPTATGWDEEMLDRAACKAVPGTASTPGRCEN